MSSSSSSSSSSDTALIVLAKGKRSRVLPDRYSPSSAIQQLAALKKSGKRPQKRVKPNADAILPEEVLKAQADYEDATQRWNEAANGLEQKLMCRIQDLTAEIHGAHEDARVYKRLLEEHAIAHEAPASGAQHQHTGEMLLHKLDDALQTVDDWKEKYTKLQEEFDEFEVKSEDTMTKAIQRHTQDLQLKIGALNDSLNNTSALNAKLINELTAANTNLKVCQGQLQNYYSIAHSMRERLESLSRIPQ